MAKKKATTFDLDAAIENAEKKAKSHAEAKAVAQAMAAPQGEAGDEYEDMAPLKAKLTGKAPGVLVTFLLKNLAQLLTTYGPTVLQLLSDLITKALSGGTTPATQ
jgi:phage-related minor tail protein